MAENVESILGIASPPTTTAPQAEPDETLQTLKAIRAELERQSKYLQNIYQIQVILFGLGVIAFVIGFAIGMGAIRLRF